jgi:polysaccharide biosynthesis transport protein
MELRDYLRVLRRRWLTVAALVVASLGTAAVITSLMTPQFTSTTRLFFGVQGSESAADLAQGSTFTQKQMSSYAEVATSPMVLDRVIGSLNLATTSEELVKNVSATAPLDTVILMISVTNNDRDEAARIANSIGSEVVSAMDELVPQRADGSQSVRATILARAMPADSPSSPNVVRNLVIGLVAGLLLGIGGGFLRHALDSKIRSEEDVQALTDEAVLGVVPFDADAPKHPIVMRSAPQGPRSEAMRRLRTNLQFVDIAHAAESVVISSSIPGEGKTTTAINLAVAMADAGSRVVLVDADLRRPKVASYLGLEGGVGLTTVLIGRARLDEVLQPFGLENRLDILPSGQIPPNPSELLGSRVMATLLKQLSHRYDAVLIDSSPLLPVTDAVVLSKSAGGTLIVVGVDRIRRHQLREAIDSLTTVDANVLGIVLNKIAKKDSSAYVYDTGYAPTVQWTREVSASPKRVRA